MAFTASLEETSLPLIELPQLVAVAEIPASCGYAEICRAVGIIAGYAAAAAASADPANNTLYIRQGVCGICHVEFVDYTLDVGLINAHITFGTDASPDCLHLSHPQPDKPLTNLNVVAFCFGRRGKRDGIQSLLDSLAKWLTEEMLDPTDAEDAPSVLPTLPA